MNNTRIKWSRKFFCNTVVVFLFVCLCVWTFSGCGKIDEDDVIIIKGEDLPETQFIEGKYVGDEITTEFCDTKVTAVYDKTVHKQIGDITELRYKITALEREGVAEEFSESAYIGFDPNGNVISFNPKIYPGRFKVQRNESTYSMELSDGKKWETESASFDTDSEAEIRTAIEKMLGDVVDWSMYSSFTTMFNETAYRGQFMYALYDSVTFQWGQNAVYGEKKQYTQREISFRLEFAHMDTEAKEHVFYENAFISGFQVTDPFGGKSIPGKYIEKASELPNLSYYEQLEFVKNGLESVSSVKYLTIYNGEVCLISKRIYRKGQDFESYMIVYPLE